MNLLTKAQEYVASLDNSDKDEYYETAQKRAHDVLCSFLKSQGIPLWNAVFTWETESSVRWITYFFLTEEEANSYVQTESERYKTSPVGKPTKVEVICK